MANRMVWKRAVTLFLITSRSLDHVVSGAFFAHPWKDRFWYCQYFFVFSSPCKKGLGFICLENFIVNVRESLYWYLARVQNIPLFLIVLTKFCFDQIWRTFEISGKMTSIVLAREVSREDLGARFCFGGENGGKCHTFAKKKSKERAEPRP